MADRYKITGKFIDNEIITKNDNEIKEAINTSFFPIQMNVIPSKNVSKTMCKLNGYIKNYTDKLNKNILFYYVPTRF